MCIFIETCAFLITCDGGERHFSIELYYLHTELFTFE